MGIAETPAPDPFDPYCFMNCLVAHTFRWRDGVLTDLGSLVDGASSTPNCINASGVVVGISENGALDPQSPFPPELRAVVWKHGRIIDLGTFGGTFSYGSTINDRNQVVGFALNPVPDPFELGECGAGGLAPTQKRAFVWHESTGLRELGTLGGPDSCATVHQQSRTDCRQLLHELHAQSRHRRSHPGSLLLEGRHDDGPRRAGRHPRPCERDEHHGQICGDSDLEGDETQHGFFWDRATMTDLTPTGPSRSQKP